MAALKGAFVDMGEGRAGARPNTVVFQFNPDRITRTPSLSQQPPRSEGAGQKDALQQPGLPAETLSFTLRLDATDQLANSNSNAFDYGILPTLSALELLMVPKPAIGAELSRSSGTASPHSAAPVKLPVVLFVWGQFRSLPVNITRLNIVETEYDTQLNPVRAEVTVEVQVIASDQKTDSASARDAYTYTQRVKKDMAERNQEDASDIGVSKSQSFQI